MLSIFLFSYIIGRVQRNFISYGPEIFLQRSRIDEHILNTVLFCIDRVFACVGTSIISYFYATTLFQQIFWTCIGPN